MAAASNRALRPRRALLENFHRRKFFSLEKLRNAPPPVDIYEILPAMPYLAIAASVSPPPAIEEALDSAIARAMRAVPAPNWSNSNTPTGPFHITVPALAIRPASTSAVRG